MTNLNTEVDLCSIKKKRRKKEKESWDICILYNAPEDLQIFSKKIADSTLQSIIGRLGMEIILSLFEKFKNM